MLNFQPVYFRLLVQEARFVHDTVINLKAIKALGVDVPPSLLVRFRG